MNAIGKRIAKLRKANGYTQVSLAVQLGVSAQSVSKWENGITMPDIMLLPTIADLFDITLDELFKNDENEPPKNPADTIPYFAYDMVLSSMNNQTWKEGYIRTLKEKLRTDHDLQLGKFSPTKKESNYVTWDIALTYVSNIDDNIKKLEDDSCERILEVLKNPNVRKILVYELQLAKKNYTYGNNMGFSASQAAAKCGIPEFEAQIALDSMVEIGITEKNEILIESSDSMFVYYPIQYDKLHFMILPIISLAEKLARNSDNWESKILLK